tara:strand:- start:412 stop:558 length:147 start_codon:yes stop_codon:yes gene_type:complete
MGERIQYPQVLQRVLFQDKPFTEQWNYIEQPENENSQGGQNIPETNYK